MIVRCYLVLGQARGNVRVRRVTQKRPYLDADEALVRLKLDVPDDAFDAPLLTVEIEKREIRIAVEAEEPLEEVEA